jgi:epoxide hydrolase-like predicted phosphatase
MSIRAVYFDLGGVIFRTEDKSPRTKLAESLGLDYAGIERIVFESKSSYQASIGAISEEEHWRNTVYALNLPESEVARVRDSFFDGDRVDQVLVDFLRSLRPNVKVGLISNAWSGLRTWIVNQKFDDAFDVMIFSSEIGVTKPDARIYQRALEKFNIRPEQAVFFDDIPANIAGAQTVGMRGFVFQTTEQAIAEIRNLLAA